MRLLHTERLQLDSFFGVQPPPYAILSHTWEREEVLFEDIRDPSLGFPHHKHGAYKIREACKVACRAGFDYIWVDTCCIDKSSSAELSESINSMFAWYRNADICYAYLGDIRRPYDDSAGPLSIENSRYFTRGWTLQEMIAPRQVIFYDCRWTRLGQREPSTSSNDNAAFSQMLIKVTGIPRSVLCRHRGGFCNLGGPFGSPVDQHTPRLYNGVCQVCSRKDTFPLLLKERFSNTQKMSWAAKRVTTRKEDQAYCLLGLFGVNMPLIYGEGDAAFIRLQEEIMRRSDDPSLLAFDHFKLDNPWATTELGLLAPSARCFESSPICLARSSRMQTLNRMTVDSKTVGIRLLLCPDDGTSPKRFWLGILACRYEQDLASRPALLLENVSHDNTVFSRVLVRQIIVRPVAMRVAMRDRSMYGGDINVAFNLKSASLQDIRLVRKKPVAPVSLIPPLRESPAFRIGLQPGISLLKIHPSDLGHQLIELSPSTDTDIQPIETPHPTSSTSNQNSIRDGPRGIMVYIPARERPASHLGQTQDETRGVLCLQVEGEQDPFYVLFYGYKHRFPSSDDRFSGVTGRAVVECGLKFSGGGGQDDPTSQDAMERALVGEARMNKGACYREGKRATLKRVDFLDHVLLELVVEAGAGIVGPVDGEREGSEDGE